MTSLVLATLAFLAQHVLISNTRVRPVLVTRLGEQGYRGGYSLVSAVLLGWMIWAYAEAPYVEIWTSPVWVHHLTVALMPIAFVLVALAILTPNPFSAAGDALWNRENPVPGVFRITRHPMMWGVTLWAGLHVWSNGDLASIVFFGGFFTLALFGPLGIDRRRGSAHPEAWQRVRGVTSYVPFAAVIQGRTGLSLREIGWWRVGVGLGLYAAFVWAHPWLFGVSPLAIP